jgi:hypothetical protein
MFIVGEGAIRACSDLENARLDEDFRFGGPARFGVSTVLQTPKLSTSEVFRGLRGCLWRGKLMVAVIVLLEVGVLELFPQD